MSRKVASLVYSRRVGTMLRKAVLAYFAERANDDGSLIYASKRTIASEIECSKQAVINTVKAFLSERLLVEAGHRKTQGGFTVVYDINLAAVEALPLAKDQDEKESTPLTGQNMDQSIPLTPFTEKESTPLTGVVNPVDLKESTPLTQTVLEPSLNPIDTHVSMERAREGKPKIRNHSLPPYWSPKPFGPDTHSAMIIGAWSDQKVQKQVEQFKSYHESRDNKFANWDKAWATWVLNSETFKNGPSTKSAPPDTSGPDAIQDTWLGAIAANQAERNAGSGHEL